MYTNLYLYISKIWNIAFIISTLLLSHIIHLFFFIFSSPNSQKKKNPLLLPISSHLLYTSTNFSPPFLPLYLPTTLFFTITLPSSFYLSYILTLLFPIIFCINLISFLPFNSYFSHIYKNVSFLSLSLLSFGGFLFFLITLIKVDGSIFFLQYVFW